MYPIICKIGPFTIYSYGLMLAIAFIVVSWLVTKRAKKENIKLDFIFDFLFLVFILGIIGARLFFVIENSGYYVKHPSQIVMLNYGGLSWYGGLLAGVTTAIIYLKKKGLSVYNTLDLVIPFLALGQAIGRTGCLLNGCCYGKASRFGIYFPVHDAVLIPTQLYSSLLLILIYIFLRYVQERPHRKGEIFFSYLALYSLMRFIMEFLRADNPVVFSGLTLFQVLSLLIFLLSSLKLLMIKKRKVNERI
ncbi:MAG: prolipoprotein diacylglyceryl transferase [Candidatus Omnitrophota bacterium]|nr:MAG: prolipoprotein diacylglyceryl transferase [Candidatus Omnitrophota bacterium]